MSVSHLFLSYKFLVSGKLNYLVLLFVKKMLLNLNDFFEHAKRRIVEIKNYATVIKL